MKKRIGCLLVAILLLTQIISVDREIANASQESAYGNEAAEEGQTPEAGQELENGMVKDDGGTESQPGADEAGGTDNGQADRGAGDAAQEPGTGEPDDPANEGAGNQEAGNPDGDGAGAPGSDGGAADGTGNQGTNDPAANGAINQDSGDRANEAAGNQEPGKPEGEDPAGQEEQGDDSESQKDIGPTGQVDVTIEPALILDKDVTFTVSLNGDERTILLNKDDGIGKKERAEARFDHLVPGEYQVTVTAPGFAAYNQTVPVGRQGVSLRLMTGFVKGFQGSHPGVLLIGDVTGDQVVDVHDAQSLTNAVDAWEMKGAVSDQDKMDLNGDGQVDLVDLQYLAMGYQAQSCTAAPEKFIPAAAIKVDPDEKTIVEGDVRALLENGGHVSLKPADGRAITSDNPVALTFDVSDVKLNNEDTSTNQADGILIETNPDNPIQRAVVALTYTDTDGTEQTIEKEVDVPVEAGVHHLLTDENIKVERDAFGNIRIHLGSQIAVKKVTLTISGTKNNNLAEISKVEFVNGMEERIPEPQMDIPENLRAEAGSEEFTVTWDPCVNVTGYEVLIQQGELSDVQRVTGNALRVTSLGTESIENKVDYTVKVQSVNGTWRSGYSQEVTVTPKPDKRPDKPDNVKAQGQYQSVAVSWKKMKNTDYYNLFYKEKEEASYHKIERIELNSYTITGLKDLTEYVVYVTGVNELGESGPSLTSIARTTDLNPPVMPKYGLINYGEEGEKGAGIVSAVTGRSNVMHDSVFDTENGTVWGTVDKNPGSYYQFDSWDDGGYNSMALGHGLTYEFDQAYEIQKIALAEFVPNGNHYFYAKVRYWDEKGYYTLSASVARKLDPEGRSYYLLTLPEKVKTKKLQIGLARYSASGSISVSEVYFYHYDVLTEDIMALYADDLHMELKPEVTQDTIDALRIRLNTPDERCGEYHPDQELLERELKNAEDILDNTSLGGIVEIHNSISTSEPNRGFGGLNAWQPIGVTAAAGDTIAIYVGHNTKKTGENTNLQLVATQYHAESSPMFTGVATLKVGMNIVEIPKIWSTDEESGGALYVQYTGNNANDRYAVRVSGGVNVPRLDLYQVADEAERLSRAAAYVEALREYTGKMESLHNEYHAGSDNSAVNRYAYNEHNCILGATDILLEDMMLSLPAGQVLRGCGSGSVQEQAEKLVRSMDAIEGMMNLFYQHKGLNDNAAAEKDRTPKRHLNIRYQRMFAGAFMYASGNHIGIEWNETAGMMGGSPIVADENGFYQSGRYFGWGISHEIGHCINQGSYAVAEVTNNYFAQLAQARETNDSVRFKYNNIYDKVTSGTTGPASNVFTQLGMYWQLHLAYDDVYNFKTYSGYEEHLDGLFFARVDTYARDASRAPAPGGVALTLAGDREQDLMRLSCAAAEKNILEFFRRWGKVPDAATIAYAEQFAEETRAIYYVTDDARRYRLTNAKVGSALGTEGNIDAVGADTRASISANHANQVDFVLASENIPASDVLGYEIARCTISGGEPEWEVVGFATGNTFSDYITTTNNRVVSYEVTLVDKYLNRSKTVSLDALKIEHDGSLDKTGWTIGAEGLTALNVPEAGTGDEDTPCAPAVEDPLMKAIDQDIATVYTGKAQASSNITIEFHRDQVISGFKYTAGAADPIGDYVFYVKDSNGQWAETVKGTLGESKTVYFANPDGKYVSTYSTDAVRLTVTGAGGRTITIGELDVLGVTGDNVDFRSADDGTVAIGRLEADYEYGDKEGDVIPKGSIVFTGAYKGNPAYNVVMLYDQDGNQVGGLDEQGNLAASQIILADVPAEGAIQNVSDGVWIYWIEPGDTVDLSKIKKVRAELYRVNDALTNEGQRLVSDSLFREMPETLPGITFTGNNAQQ